MRIVFALLALVAAGTASAEPSTPRGIVMAYECSHVDASRTGFTCALKNGELYLHRRESLENMSQEKREFSDYEYYRIALRYFELGGTVYIATDDSWGTGKQKNCSPVNGQFYNVMCMNLSSK